MFVFNFFTVSLFFLFFFNLYINIPLYITNYLKSGDFSRGSLIGEVEVLTGSIWANTIFARRDCELVAMKREVTIRYGK